MEHEHFKMDFKSIKIIEEYFPEDTINAAFIEGKYTWQFRFNFGVDYISKDSLDIHIKINHSMVELANPENVILNLVTDSVIKALGSYSERDKVGIIKRFLSICLWNTRGVFAAKVENTAYAKILPMDLSPDSFEQQITDRLKDEWN